MLLAHTFSLPSDMADPEFERVRRVAIPEMDELAGEWMQTSMLRSLPALNSGRGAGKVTGNLLEVGDLCFPPLTMYGTTGRLMINGHSLLAEWSRWYPYQVLRRSVANGITCETSVRMPYERQGLLFRMSLTNTGAARQTLPVAVDLSAAFSAHESWGWAIPRTPVAQQAAVTLGPQGAVTLGGRGITFSNLHSGCASCYCFAAPPGHLAAAEDGGQARWSVTLEPGQTWSMECTLAVEDTARAAQAQASASADAFDPAFSQVKADWQRRFEAMFTPGNTFFSGSLPRLETDDQEIKRIYYMSAVSLLSVCRTCFPIAPRVYVTNTPEDNGTMMYFWDTREWATCLALLDPAMLRHYLEGWFERGIHNGYAEEFLKGTLQGPWYSANDLSIFILIDTYLNVTQDSAFLSAVVGRKTVLQHMQAIATYWQHLVRPGRTLADYGGADNLLECVPTYLHEVPSFNAANVWMMRRAAALLDANGRQADAAGLRAVVDPLLAAVLSLYEPGQGVWSSQRPDGARVQMRHVLDFVTVGQTITEDLSSAVRREMTAFVERELLVDHWMRAQSLSDPAASASDRPDHGPMGAFTAWPAETIATFCAFGEFRLALDFLRRCAAVTTEGPFSQSREILGTAPDSLVRIAVRGDQTYNASCGGSFAETVIRSLFGYQPNLLSSTLIPDQRSRGFHGTLHGIRYGKHLYRITSDQRGILAAHS